LNNFLVQGIKSFNFLKKSVCCDFKFLNKNNFFLRKFINFFENFHPLHLPRTFLKNSVEGQKHFKSMQKHLPHGISFEFLKNNLNACKIFTYATINNFQKVILKTRPKKLTEKLQISPQQ
jgi:hypothetical protein